MKNIEKGIVEMTPYDNDIHLTTKEMIIKIHDIGQKCKQYEKHLEETPTMRDKINRNELNVTHLSESVNTLFKKIDKLTSKIDDMYIKLTLGVGVTVGIVQIVGIGVNHIINK